MSEMMSIEHKANALLDQARTLATSVDSWVDFSNCLFDQEGGLIAQTFDDDVERQAFYDSEQYKDLYKLFAKTMKRNSSTS